MIFIPPGLSPETEIGSFNQQRAELQRGGTDHLGNDNNNVAEAAGSTFPDLSVPSQQNSRLLNNTSGLFDSVLTPRSPRRRRCYVAVPGFNHFWPLSTSCLKSETA